ncbi:MAG: aminotransferase class V-fold PLP-dependent enzyme [Lachnospiraceae bacterium]|nr:aminotransferase class V-fold PLP-dependent enzyme [Lachnospiraceae bacterium]
MKRLCEALREHTKRKDQSCHMPGHKENTGAFLGDVLKYDITEIDGMDNLHDASGVILESERFAADLYGSEETHFLINGSTVGILSSILALTKPGDEILIARNCHKSVYNAVMVGRLKCRYVYPAVIDRYGLCGGIENAAFREALKEYPGIRVAVITSPTYDGIASDISALAKEAHEHGVMLIVDAAHGAHFGFSKGFPGSAVKNGADIVINSVHKTLTAPTQTALIHINGPHVDREAVGRMLRIYQSSSPSYLLMAGIDDCMSLIAGRGKELFKQFFENIGEFETKAGRLKNLKYIGRNELIKECGVFDADPCKVIISTAGTGYTGRELYYELRNTYHIEPEMAAGTYCLLIMTIMDEKADFDRVAYAVECIDEKFSDRKAAERYKDLMPAFSAGRPVQVMQAYEVAGADRHYVNIKDAQGMISADYIMNYPPGIPLLVPGERIDPGLIDKILKDIDSGINVMGITKNKEAAVYG